MAVERYILICKGDRAAVLLSNNRRQIFDLFTVILSLIIPATIFAEYVYWEIEKRRNFLLQTPCIECYRERIQPWEYLGRIPGVHIPTIIACSFLYYKCIQQLRSSKQIARKDLLITAFIALLVAWVVMVTPHTAFVDYVNKGQTFGFSIVLWSEVHEVEYNLIEAGILTHALYEDVESRQSRLTQQRNYTIEAILRLFKMSFGFVNSILLVILIKPFNRPLLEKLKTVKSRLRERFGQ
ncbi:uncharacterized protein LOC142348752 [Convolutriloba macropyga]|uniref:uncharacterized protein LOC142348752 n=1 Tax=Convolutriloba macropyga TaxID=536237 RepID=UPI003F5237CD